MKTAEQTVVDVRGREVELTGSGPYYTFRFFGMGTDNEVMFRLPSRLRALETQAAVMDWIIAFEKKYSVFREDSLVSRINRTTDDWVGVDSETEALFSLCDWFNWKTEGLFDPTSGVLNKLWDYHVVHERLPSQEEVRRCLDRVGWKRFERRNGSVRLPEGMRIDLGGIGKEYAVDRVFELVSAHGATDLLVNFGQDLRVAGSPPEEGAWKAGLERPDTPGFCWGGAALNNAALCSSGNYLRYFEFAGKRYGHIIDPRTGWPADSGCMAVWICAPTCTEAGILATSSYIMGPTKGLDFVERVAGASGCAWTDHGVSFTKGFPVYHET